MSTTRPIYSLIEESIVDGRLPDDFAIPEDNTIIGDQRMKMAPGAMDGIHVYHMPPSEMSDEEKNTIASAVLAATSGDDNAYSLFRKLGESHRAISIIDDIQEFISGHASEIDQSELFRFAFEDLILGGIDTECVKFGLIITELYGELDENLKRIIRVLGLYDEFTIFVVFNMLTWNHANEEIFELAKHVDSWGKIHAVERLQPDTQEIRDWLLYEGMDNEVMPDYLALTCFMKSDAPDRLKGSPTKKEFGAISHILYYLFEEGPVWGISHLPNSEDVLKDYLDCAEKQSLAIGDYDTILQIRDYTSENESLYMQADQLLRSDDCRIVVEKSILEGKGISLAEELNIPYKQQLLEAIGRDFKANFHWCSTLMQDPEYVEPVLEIYRKRIPPESIEQDPRDEFEHSDEYRQYLQLRFMLQNLGPHVGKGIDYMMRTISAPVFSNRYRTAKVITAWVVKEQKPLPELFPELYSRLQQAYAIEPDERIKNIVNQLLSGATSFEDND